MNDQRRRMKQQELKRAAAILLEERRRAKEEEKRQEEKYWKAQREAEEVSLALRNYLLLNHGNVRQESKNIFPLK